MSLIHQVQCLQQPLVALYELCKVEGGNCLLLQPLLEAIHYGCDVGFPSSGRGQEVLQHSTTVCISAEKGKGCSVYEEAVW